MFFFFLCGTQKVRTCTNTGWGVGGEGAVREIFNLNRYPSSEKMRSDELCSWTFVFLHCFWFKDPSHFIFPHLSHIAILDDLWEMIQSQNNGGSSFSLATSQPATSYSLIRKPARPHPAGSPQPLPDLFQVANWTLLFQLSHCKTHLLGLSHCSQSRAWVGSPLLCPQLRNDWTAQWQAFFLSIGQAGNETGSWLCCPYFMNSESEMVVWQV